MVGNHLIEVSFRFSLVSLLYACFHAGSCKNQTASKKIDFIVENQEQKTHTTTNLVAIDQKDDIIASASNDERQKNHFIKKGDDYQYGSSKNASEQMHQVDTLLSFTLKDITIKAGTVQSILLEATGNTEGYSIKSVSIQNNGSNCTKKFGIGTATLKNKPIPPTGLPITLTTDPKLKAGSYAFKMKIGKTGKGSQATAQWVKCMIYIIEDEVKNETQNASGTCIK